MKIKLGIIGACGRMGQGIARLTEGSELFELVSVIENSKHPSVGKNFREITGLGNAHLCIVSELPEAGKVDVVIDFSHRESTLTHLKLAAKRGIAYVIGTTGFDENGKAIISDCARKTSVLFSPNMSVGMNVLFQAAGFLAEKLGKSYDMEIVELHHNQKTDSPSGTALKLFEVIRSAVDRDEHCGVYGRKGMVGKRTSEEIGIHAVRAGDIIGEHRLILAGCGEQIELTHRVQTRETFAHGALRGAEFIAGKKPGLYDMTSVLGLS
jgi:4-hydroxy-tetrahydrodipicolinate reductase